MILSSEDGRTRPCWPAPMKLPSGDEWIAEGRSCLWWADALPALVEIGSLVPLQSRWSGEIGRHIALPRTYRYLLEVRPLLESLGPRTQQLRIFTFCRIAAPERGAGSPSRGEEAAEPPLPGQVVPARRGGGTQYGGSCSQQCGVGGQHPQDGLHALLGEGWAANSLTIMSLLRSHRIYECSHLLRAGNAYSNCMATFAPQTCFSPRQQIRLNSKGPYCKAGYGGLGYPPTASRRGKEQVPYAPPQGKVIPKS